MKHSPKYCNTTVTEKTAQLESSHPVDSSAGFKSPYSCIQVTQHTLQLHSNHPVDSSAAIKVLSRQFSYVVSSQPVDC